MRIWLGRGAVLARKDGKMDEINISPGRRMKCNGSPFLGGGGDGGWRWDGRARLRKEDVRIVKKPQFREDCSRSQSLSPFYTHQQPSSFTLEWFFGGMDVANMVEGTQWRLTTTRDEIIMTTKLKTGDFNRCKYTPAESRLDYLRPDKVSCLFFFSISYSSVRGRRRGDEMTMVVIQSR